MTAASWIIVDKHTGKAVMETFNKPVHLNTKNFRAVPVLEWLQSLNAPGQDPVNETCTPDPDPVNGIDGIDPAQLTE